MWNCRRTTLVTATKLWDTGHVWLYKTNFLSVSEVHTHLGKMELKHEKLARLFSGNPIDQDSIWWTVEHWEPCDLRMEFDLTGFCDNSQWHGFCTSCQGINFFVQVRAEPCAGTPMNTLTKWHRTLCICNCWLMSRVPTYGRYVRVISDSVFQVLLIMRKDNTPRHFLYMFISHR